MLGRDYMVSYTQRLSQEMGGLIRCGDESRVATGEFAMLYSPAARRTPPICAGPRRGSLHHRGRRHGDAHLLRQYPEELPRAQHRRAICGLPELRRGQQQLWEVSRRDLWVYPQSNSRKLLENIRASGGKLATGSPQWLASMTGFPGLQRELEAILQQSSR